MIFFIRNIKRKKGVVVCILCKLDHKLIKANRLAWSESSSTVAYHCVTSPQKAMEESSAGLCTLSAVQLDSSLYHTGWGQTRFVNKMEQVIKINMQTALKKKWLWHTCVENMYIHTGNSLDCWKAWIIFSGLKGAVYSLKCHGIIFMKSYLCCFCFADWNISLS